MDIDGAWRPADGRDTIEVVNPADEQVIGKVPAGTALDRRHRRTGRLRRPAGLLAATSAERAPPARPPCGTYWWFASDEVAETVTAELGSPLKFSQAAPPPPLSRSRAPYAELAATYAS